MARRQLVSYCHRIGVGFESLDPYMHLQWVRDNLISFHLLLPLPQVDVHTITLLAEVSSVTNRQLLASILTQ